MDESTIMDEDSKDRLQDIISAWKNADTETHLQRINVLLSLVKEEVTAKRQGKERLLLKITDHNSPSRTRREDIEKSLDELKME